MKLTNSLTTDMTLMTFNQLIDILPEYIIEQDATWNDVINYVFQHYKQPTFSEWVIIDRTFDSCFPVQY